MKSKSQWQFTINQFFDLVYVTRRFIYYELTHRQNFLSYNQFKRVIGL